jgi:aryl-alcohol dehydrogenase (NADP+)
MSFGTPEWRDWVLPEDESRPIIRKALELGINFYDTADMYSQGVSEEVLGRAIRDFTRREEVVIATKAFYPTGVGQNERGLSRVHLFRAVEESLTRLGTDYIDLYQIHRWDHETPIDETLEALHDIVKLGMVRYIGASSMHAWQFVKSLYLADLNGWTRFVSMQNHYNLLYREEEREMMPLCREEGIGVIPWSPLARGILAGNRALDGIGRTTRAKSDRFTDELYQDESDFDIVERVMALAKQRRVSPAQISLAWLLQQPGVTAPIIGTTSMDHLHDAVSALDLSLSEDECKELEEPYRPRRVRGHA